MPPHKPDKPPVIRTLKQAGASLQAGQLAQARAHYQQVLRLAPHHAQAHHGLGVIAVREGQLADALLQFKAALEATPQHPPYWEAYVGTLLKLGHLEAGRQALDQARQMGLQGAVFDTLAAELANSTDIPAPSAQESETLVKLFNQGDAGQAEALARTLTQRYPRHGFGWKVLAALLKRDGRLEESLPMAQQAAELTPTDAEAHMNLANTLQDLGRSEEAEAGYLRALQLNPQMAKAHNNLSRTLLALGRPQEAEASSRLAVQMEPGNESAHNNLGNALRQLGRLEEAEQCYLQALRLKPDFGGAHNNLGVTQHDLGRLEEAQASYRQALAINADDAEAWNNLGVTLRDMGQWAVAEACHQRAIHIDPKDARAYSNLGAVLNDMGRLDESTACYREALRLQPNLAQAHSNLGNTLKDLGELELAEASYRRALRDQPDLVNTYANLLFTLNYHPDKSAEEIFATYLEYDKQVGLPRRALWRPHGNDRTPDRRLKVGYMSPDFKRHSCQYFLEPLLARHDKARVEVYAYAELATEDAVTGRYKGYVDHWLSTRGMGDDALAERIRADGIDILVDLAGHTKGNRLPVFARKPAPVSLSWLGFGYTTGLSAIDYFLTDRPTVPEGAQTLFSETPWRLPGPALTYRPAAGMGEVSPLPALAAGRVTFGTLTRAVRINHRVVRAWSEILRRVAGSRLVINSADFRSDKAIEALAQRFVEQGIARDRLAIGHQSPPWDVLRGVDIGLDCFPHNSGTTLFESLYMGVPFVSLAGRPSVGTLGSAILHGLGRTDWLAHSEAQYVDTAVSLAGDLAALARTREHLRGDMQRSPLMDEVGFAARVETAYGQMWQAWLSGEEPAAAAPGPGRTQQAMADELVALFNQQQFVQAQALAREMTTAFPRNGFAWKVSGAVARRLGHPEQALAMMRTAVQLSPGDAEAHCNLANALRDGGQLQEAVTTYRDALQLQPAFFEAHINLGHALGMQGQHEGALAAFQQAVALRPDNAMAHNNLGNALRALGRLADAQASYQHTLALAPQMAEAHANLGLTLSDMGLLEPALASYQRALDIAPQQPDVLNNLGNLLQAMGRFHDAQACYLQAIRLKPAYAQAHNNLGVTLHSLGQLQACAASYARAASLDPGYFEARNNLGIVLNEMGQTDKAVAAFEGALQIRPDSAEAACNLGVALHDGGRFTEAETWYRRAMALGPLYAPAHNNLANLLKDLGRLDEAQDSYQQALRLAPDRLDTYDNLLFTLNYHADKSAQEIFASYQSYERQLLRGLATAATAPRPTAAPRQRLRIGYVSPDFRAHSCRYFLEPLLAHHDKAAVEVFAYAEVKLEDALTARYKRHADHWCSTVGMSDDALAQRIRDDGIDILVDLAGHTSGNRLPVFARQPAPLAVSWLGFGYTTGLTAIDYFLTDWASTPQGAEPLFSERPWRLDVPPFAYRPAPDMGEPGPLPALASGRVTFSTLTRAVRINHRTVRVWSDILKRVPDARLRVDSGNYRDPAMHAALAARFEDHGIARDRLLIGYHTPPWDVLRDTDITLDCFPHNSGTTLFESLYMGVPFVTLAGRPSVGRLGASILGGLGHPQWVAQSEADYADIAVGLAQDLNRLAALRAGLREQLRAGPLMDEAGFARAVETAYRQMWQQRLLDQPRG